MAVQHSVITDPNIHEPKGASTALSGQVYVSDGAGSGAWDLAEPRGIDAAVSGDIYVANGSGSGTWRQAAEASGSMTITNNATPIALTAAVDPTFQTFSDYVQITGFAAGELDKLTYATNAMTITATHGGLYLVDTYLNVSADVINVDFAIKFAVNGASGVSRRPRQFLAATNEWYNLSANGLVRLNDGDLVTLFMVADKTCNIIVQDCAFVLHKVGV